MTYRETYERSSYPLANPARVICKSGLALRANHLLQSKREP
ncbi:hypothetical protein [Helicobacter typhlonius]